MDEKKNGPFFKEPTLEEQVKSISGQLIVMSEQLRCLVAIVERGNRVRMLLLGGLLGYAVSILINGFIGR